MKRNFTHENFERFLQQNADGLRMRPSDRVWKGISRHLNGNRRRWGFVLGISLLITSSLGYYWTHHTQQGATSRTTVTNQASLPNVTALNKPSQAPGQPSMQQFGRSKQRPGLTFASRNEKAALLLPDASADNNATSTLPSKEFVPETVDSYLSEAQPEYKQEERKAMNPDADPQTIESIINSYQSRKRKIGTQIYFTPTVSYRKLNDNNIDNIVTHRPDFGFELGMAAKYPVSKNMKIRGGFQLNVSRYGIRTYQSITEVATIRLNSRRGVNYVNTITNYNNFGGYQSNWLENFYFQVSAPVGVEWKLRGDDRVQFGVASTIQPTYLLGDRAYLISSDYKNYTQVPKLVRHWNLNTSIETFVSYSTGRLKWQVGPQARYQLLSSYVNKYPVKENLFDFGLKIGVSLNNQ